MEKHHSGIPELITDYNGWVVRINRIAKSSFHIKVTDESELGEVITVTDEFFLDEVLYKEIYQGLKGIYEEHFE